MQKIVFYIGGGIAIVVGVLIFLMYIASQNTYDIVDENDTKINIATTIFPLYDITRIIAGDRADVQLLLPPGASPHFYEFTPQQINNLKNTNIAFVIGNGIDDWAHDAFTANNTEIITVDDGIELHASAEKHEHAGEHEENMDPHYWLSPSNAMIMTQTIADTLAQKDPDNASIYQQNAQNFINELTDVNIELQSQIQQLSCKEIIVTHGAWYYFAQHFGLDIVGVFMPETGTTPSPRYLSQLKAATEASCGDVIFGEPQLSTQSIDTFADDNELVISVIDPIGGVAGRDTYIDLIVYNVRTIIDGLKK